MRLALRANERRGALQQRHTVTVGPLYPARATSPHLAPGPSIRGMHFRIFWHSLLVQALAVGALFGLLFALPLEREFFRDYGPVIGPLAWTAGAVVTGRVLSLALTPVLLAALGAGVTGLLAGLAIGHGPGLLVSLPLFAACCAAAARSRDPAPARRLGADTPKEG